MHSSLVTLKDGLLSSRHDRFDFTDVAIATTVRLFSMSGMAGSPPARRMAGPAG
jgi:hypothetical protein